LCDQALVERYEELRGGVVGGEAHRGGRALLMHRGMVSWMEACSVCLPAVKRSQPCAASMASTGRLPNQVEWEVVRVMAEMAWAACGR